MMTKRMALMIAAFYVVYLAVLVGFSYFPGFPTRGNSYTFQLLWVFMGYTGFITISLISVVFLVMAFRKPTSPALRGGLIMIILVSLGLCLIIHPLTWILRETGIRHDLISRDLDRIRADVAEVLKRPPGNNAKKGYFGEPLALESLPPSIASLSATGLIERMPEGVVVQTDGIKDWRGGYLFLPPGTDQIEMDRTQYFMPGVYYILLPVPVENPHSLPTATPPIP